MSTVVCKGFQSCLEPQLLETTTLRLKLISPNSIAKNREPSVFDSHTNEIRDKCHNDDIKISPTNVTNSQISSNLEMGSWNFLQSLSNSPQIPQKPIGNIESPYVDPFKPSSFSRLSDKSLELCTESLGSETGSDTIESSILSLDLENEISFTRERKSSRVNSASRKENSRNFPPPLTSISGSNHVLVRSHCEGGRLIIKAIESPPSHTCFQVERSQGRLRLSYMKNDYDSKFGVEESVESNEEDDIPELENGGEICEEIQEDNEEEYEGGGDEESDGYLRKDMEGNSFDVEEKMGIEKLQTPSRCKENRHGDKGLCKWEGFWVATS
ncbi:hypothetical protein LguiA_030875 [Lonicera macranthoides]